MLKNSTITKKKKEKEKEVELILQMSALIIVTLLQIIRYKWNKSFLVAYTGLDPAGGTFPIFDLVHEHGLPLEILSGCFLSVVKTNNKSDGFLYCYDLGCCWLVEHGLNGQLYTPVYTSTEEFACFRYLCSCFLNQPRQTHFTAA